VPYVGTQATVAVLAQEARDYLHAVAWRLRRRGLAVTTQVSVGAAAPSITEYARSSAGNLVVLASHRRAGWRRVLVGSVARRIAQAVPTPVIVCPLESAEAQPTLRDVAAALVG
jgi:nucleotide-binding universal stress UspA family protein